MDSVTTKFITEEHLPLVVEPENPQMTLEGFLDWVENNHEFIQKKLLKYGGILFRGFAVDGADDFNKVIDTIGLGKPLNYIGGDTPRDKVKGKVYTSTEAPASFMIPLHNEMSFIKNYPSHIYFHCHTPPKEGGETTIADARQIYQAIDPAVKERFAKRGLCYISNFYKKSLVLDTINRFQRAHKTWMNAFETDEKDKVEQLCSEQDYGFCWKPRNWLQVTYNRPAVMEHPDTNEKVWFNQAHLYDYNPRLLGIKNWIGTKLIYLRKDTLMHEIRFGDESKIAREDLYHVMDVLEQKTIKFPWQKGDVMILDNVLAMHGRAPFSGKRRILAALTR